MANTTINIVLSAATLLAALAIGLLLRRMVIKRLDQSVLDGWIVQTLGIAIIIPPLILGTIIALAIWNTVTTVINYLNDRGIDLYAIGTRLLVTALLIALSIGTARTLRKQIVKGLTRGLGETRIDINIRTLIGRIISILILTISGFWTLSVWDIGLSIPIAAVSVITVVITIAIQDILKDLMAGFYLLLSRPFYIGDQISVTLGMLTYFGKVLNIELRATRLQLVTGEEVSIPNAQLFNNPVINTTYFEERRAAIEVKIPVAEFARQETALRILQELKECEAIIPKPEPQVFFQSYAEEKAILLVRFWISSKRSIDVSDIMYTLHALFPNAELTIREPAGNTL